MITRAEAEERLAGGVVKVVYRPPHLPNTKPGYEGVITSVNNRGAFVRYGDDSGSQLTNYEDLHFISASLAYDPSRQAVVPDPDSVTHFRCPEREAGDNSTHYLVPAVSASENSRPMYCRYCRKTERELRREHGL